MRTQRWLLALALACGISGNANAGAPPPRFGDGFGVNIKIERITSAELVKIAVLGIARVRTGISWYQVEQNKDAYRWDLNIPRHPSADDYAPDRAFTTPDAALAAIAAAGLHADVTLHEGNGVYSGKSVNISPPGKPESLRIPAPRTPEDIAAFAAFAAATVEHYEALYGNQAITWHIWNEPDYAGSYAPTIDAARFGALLAATCSAIRKVSPDAKIMGPALGAHGEGDIDLAFLRGIFTNVNPLPCLNGFTIHPYRSAVPETAPQDYATVAAALAPWQPKDKPAVPVAVDEWGYSIAKARYKIPVTQLWRDFSGEEQAALFLRLYLTNLAAGVPLTVIYDWRDRGTDVYEWEDNFGIVDFKGEAKPALRMFETVWPLLRHRPLRETNILQGCSPHEHALRFGPRGDDTSHWVVAWTDAPQPVDVHVEGTMVEAKDIFGKKTAFTDNKVGLSGKPVLLSVGAETKMSLECKHSLQR